MIVSRTCSEISAGDADRRQDEEPRPVEAFRDAPAYVLLGDPGAGKTTAFEVEREALGEQACLVSARDFLTFDPQHHPEWFGKTLFIDGLDEVRAGMSDARTPFDQIRRHLDKLGKPHFRLSCREADWLGANDRNHLEAVSPGDKVTVLRLNPLTDSDIAQLLAAYPRVDDAEAFIAEANERGIGDLLRNPQTLDLLAKAVAGGTWPESRRETFELACEQMVQEHSDEHSAALASSSPPAPGQLLDAAGRLCAIQLVAGKAGYTLHGKQDSKDKYPTLEQCGGDHPDRLRLALATKLFKGVSDNRFTPVHRHVSEFLGARYLAQVIGDQTVPLPARRVIALITGADGTVVTEMRGLSAWLAAHCPEARAELIERDPVGVGLYGDVRRFSLHEKRVLLESLGREGSHLGSMWEEAAAFGSLATPDLEPAFRNILEARNRDREAQIFTGFVLCVLEQGVPLPGISEILLGIVRDDTRWPIVKATALDAFIHNCPDGQIRTNELKTLLADIYSEGISDPDNELLGILLTQLYPRDIPPSEVWEYLFEAGERDFYGVYRYFWKIGLLDKSSDEQVAELLDHLQQSPALQHALESRGLEDIPLKLLARGLKARGDQLNTASLYDWLGVGQAEGGYWSSDESAQEIRAWLEQRPEVQKAVILEGLGRCLESEDFDSQAFEVYKRLYHAEQAPDFGLWCLHQADIKANTKPRIANHLLTMVCGTVRGAAHGIVNTQSGSGGLTLDILQAYARKHDLLKAGLDPLLAPHPIPPKYLEERRKNQAYIEERRQKEEQWFEYVRSNEVALRENRAAPFLLHELARKYFGDDSTSNGPKAVEEALRGDQRLTQAVLQGFRGAVDREDVPAFEESLSFQAQGRRHYLAWPFLAGLAEIERTAPEDATQ